MSSLAAATIVIGFLVLVGAPILWLIFRSGVPHPAEQAVADREFIRQLENPDFAGLEVLLGRPLPPVVSLLYSGRQFELAATLAEFLQLPRRQSVEADD